MSEWRKTEQEPKEKKREEGRGEERVWVGGEVERAQRRVSKKKERVSNERVHKWAERVSEWEEILGE